MRSTDRPLLTISDFHIPLSVSFNPCIASFSPSLLILFIPPSPSYSRIPAQVRRIGEGVVAGFAGSAADGMSLLERLEMKLEEHPGKSLEGEELWVLGRGRICRDVGESCVD